MPKKTAAKAKAKCEKAQKQAARKAKAEAKKKSAKTLLEVSEIEEARPVKKRRVYTEEYKVAKIRNEQFKYWPDSLCCLKIIDGKNLMQHLFHDREMGVTMGKIYYDLRRQQFMDSTAPECLLAVADKTQIVDKRLDAALATFKGCGDAEALFLFFTGGPAANQRSFVGLSRAMLAISPYAGGAQSSSLLLAWMRYIKRNSLHTTFDKECSILVKHWNLILLKSATTFKTKSKNASYKLWWNGNKDAASLILPPAAMDECMTIDPTTGKWDDHEEALGRVVNAGPVGERIFGFAFRQVTASKTTDLVDKAIRDLMKTKITKSSSEKALEAFENSVRAIGRDPYTAGPIRKVSFVYRGITVEDAPVRFPVEEYNLRREALFQTVGVDKGYLPVIWNEDDLTPDGYEKSKLDIDRCLLVDNGNARELAQTFLEEDSEACDAAKVSEVIKEQSQILMDMDRGWKMLSLTFSSFVGDLGAKRLQIMILTCLPNTDLVLTPQDSKTKLDVVEKSKIMNFVDMIATTIFSAVKTFVVDLAKPACPEFDSQSPTEFLMSVKSRLEWFFDIDSLTDVPVTVLSQVNAKRGRTALIQYFDAVKKVAAEKPEDVTEKVLEPLHTFKFVLSEEQLKALKAFSDSALERAGVAIGITANGSKGDGKGKTKTSPAKKQESSTAGLFD